MAKILLIYATTDGHTLEICQRLKEVIEQAGQRVQLQSITDAATLDLECFDKIVLGASIRYGKHSRQVYDFIERNRQILDRKPNGFFSVNVVARKPEKSRPETNPYLLKFLKQISWQPKQLAVFGGKLDYPSYRYWDRQMIRAIMWMTKGPTAPDTVVEYTDWQQVEAFGRLVTEM
ncbi:MAG: menaquinone-dependent protoporphyrinogen IX dehydrogenase [Desulfobulbaceae bacterium]|nr:menaquinone-dependent protoporphyrinogen IX dehydrogenase [Desulfobulbaceae bacterium]